MQFVGGAEHDHEVIISGSETTRNSGSGIAPGLGSDDNGWSQRADQYVDQRGSNAGHLARPE